ncbi:hypothetical protein F9C07_6271 [Aspergillus flavus]|uniref:Uncharacterized protein n=5 Tax=Aspergillus subgen. Circumdati TaxID=2720871 RepID=B8NDA1_ASPFN|nr:unnamed protein product [Aspergillus oryzae RIB40]XP_041147628.1 uncharacterized protein G4B84_008056 [Aspergillus flavus NRRL3357]EIT80583.1 hypothetical protein Ao3042_02808 [Aspergillus oryzae 3.042]KAB8245814.1 hypothetical protein BDV35DRAFT_242619 [Aspergillus flavus]KDE80802.1 hypothetical protein AO1008_07345 [Aspergillus oryzae 100-8]OOO05942.1 hypothetical protein OAory_01016030 [Aspergillus oryzae]KAF7616642.1 hypothetical protein AFLA_004700 [Aspergillus flavus NRRL3357]|eukprot:EIT80583.1 hypothetical protein Ao3042_02808 [Aspergillus oryzae 3.042]
MSSTNPETTSSKRKAPDDRVASKAAATQAIHFTARNPPWTYLKLQLIHQPGTSTAVQSQPLDPLTARTHINSALSQFLGLSGTAISIDILKILPEAPQPKPTDKFIWLRVPRQDAPAVVAAVSSWIGGGTGGGSVGSVAWRVCAKGNYLGALTQGSGEDLFAP